jgi:hypothetical protein
MNPRVLTNKWSRPIFEASRNDLPPEEAETVGFLNRLWKAISDVQFGDTPAWRAEPDDAHSPHSRPHPSCGLSARLGPGRLRSLRRSRASRAQKLGRDLSPARELLRSMTCSRSPLLRFLDTRGLGEADYDPAGYIPWCEGQSHLLLTVMQVADPVQDAVLRVLRQARRRHPDWPLVVAQTGLHRYPASTHGR